MSFQRDPAKTAGNCAAANAAQIADADTAAQASVLWAALYRASLWLWNDPAEAERCRAKNAAFYARLLELQAEEARR